MVELTPVTAQLTYMLLAYSSFTNWSQKLSNYHQKLLSHDHPKKVVIWPERQITHHWRRGRDDLASYECFNLRLWKGIYISKYHQNVPHGRKPKCQLLHIKRESFVWKLLSIYLWNELMFPSVIWQYDGYILAALYFVSPRERPWHQRVVQNKTLVIGCLTYVISHGIDTQRLFYSVYSLTRFWRFSRWDKL